METIDDYVLTQAIEKRVRRGAMHVHGPYTYKKGFVVDVKVEDSLGCSA